MVMIGFTLSKMNLLIFVTAMFVIIVYFTFGFSDVLMKERATQLITRYTDEVLSLVNSKSLCVNTSVTVPGALPTLGSQDLFYIIRIDSIKGNSSASPPTPNSLILSLAKRREPNKILAARRIDTFAEIHLFALQGTDEPPSATPSQINTGELQNSNWDQELDTIYIDPQRSTPIDSFFVAKETFGGKNYVYLVNCSEGGTTGSATGGCGNSARLVGTVIKQSSRGVSNCVEAPE